MLFVNTGDFTCYLLTQVMSKQGEWFEKYEDVPERLRTQISPSIFPPPHEQAVAFGLHRWFVFMQIKVPMINCVMKVFLVNHRGIAFPNNNRLINRNLPKIC